MEWRWWLDGAHYGDSHGYDSHAHRAGCQALAAWLRKGVSRATVTVSIGWPNEPSLLAQADAVIVYCDGLGGHEINGREAAITELAKRAGRRQTLARAAGFKVAFGLRLRLVLPCHGATTTADRCRNRLP